MKRSSASKSYFISTKNLKLLLIMLLSFIFCNKDSDVNISDYQVVSLEKESLIDSDYIFDNEGLNQPFMIRENPTNKDLVVLDTGNISLYVFSPVGEFKRKIGRLGQGPGEFIEPKYFNIDSYGDIYVYDYSNQRISIFNQSGKLFNTFRVQAVFDSKFSISGNREIIINAVKSGYYISVYSRDGNLIKEIGEIPKLNKYNNEKVNRRFAEGWPFQDINGNYYIFLHYMPIVKVFDRFGKIVKEVNLSFPEIEIKLRHFVPPQEHKYLKDPWTDYFNEILYRNNKFFLLTVSFFDNKGKLIDIPNVFIYVIDINFKTLEKYHLIISNKGLQGPSYVKMAMFNNFQVEISNDENNIFFPHFYNSEIIRFLH